MIETHLGILEIALPVPLFRTFDYLCPSLADGVVPSNGARVRVAFGSRELVGVVVGRKARSEVPQGKLKPLIDVIDPVPLLCAADLALAQWVVNYYHAPPGEMLTLLLPVSLRRGKPLDPVSRASRKKNREGVSQEGTGRQVSARQASARQASVSQACAEEDVASHRISSESISREEVVSDRTPGQLNAGADIQVVQAGYALSPGQEAACKVISAYMDGFQPILLDGVTGSGKTEVYLQMATHALRRGRQVLILVPEIGLVAQLARRVQRRFGIAADVYHSDLSDKERLTVWRRSLRNEARIIVGTRSALFLPLPELGLMMVDEEHDLSYKQQESVRYSARDVAVRRAQTRNIPIILGSATPALETLANVTQGRYLRVALPERVTQRPLPEVQLIDTRGISCQDGLSPILLNAIQEQLEAGSQVLLFLNRRGYAPVIYCADCGWVANCERCSTRLTYHHQKNRLRCHHCGTDKPLQPQCPECGGERLMPVGKGTERLEIALKARFPERVVTRIDRDTARSSEAFEALMVAVRDRKIDILVGTQMLAKGHHLPGIGLAAIVDMDTALYSLDFRALERAGQMITQVFGRSGRGEAHGKVMIQTTCPEHPVLEVLLRQGYGAFAEQILVERHAARLPPHSFQVVIRAEAHRLPPVEQFLEEVRQRISVMNVPAVDVFGPLAGTLEKCAGYYRRILVLQCRRRAPLHNVLAALISQLDAGSPVRSVRWHIDVDPQEMG